MSSQKPQSIHRIEERMEGMKPQSFRYKALESAKRFKSSWIELGQYLYTVYNDKIYKEWGYLTFEAYCAKEVGIRQSTAVKLLKSYSFLEHEEPEFLKREVEERSPGRIPGFESVNALRLAKANENLSEKDYHALREEVLENVKEDAEAKKKIRYVLKAKTPAKPAQPGEQKAQFAKKAWTQLEAMKNEMAKLDLPDKLMRKIDELLEALSDYRL